MEEPREVPLYQSANRPNLLMGCDREMVLLAALLSDEPYALHAPAPNGLVGGYPVTISRKGVAVDLPREWTLEQALGVNAAALTYVAAFVIVRTLIRTKAEPVHERVGAVEESDSPSGIRAVLAEVRSPVNGVLFTLREYPLVYEGSLMARVMETR